MEPAPVSDMLRIVKAREIQRAMLAEMRNDSATATRHFLAAGHLELVLAEDYRIAKDDGMTLRSLISAASCFWRGGRPEEADRVFADIRQAFPAESATVQHLRDELFREYPARAS